MLSMRKKKCKECKAELEGESLFYPELCLDCIIDLEKK